MSFTAEAQLQHLTYGRETPEPVGLAEIRVTGLGNKIDLDGAHHWHNSEILYLVPEICFSLQKVFPPLLG